ncbi:MAG: hypothetical protein LW625_10205 [Planctomycetaceae bacterium]|nr:hypothetical protein [Planctomycetaceae bacterium]
MRNASLAAALAVGVTGSAFATISNQLVGDSYIVKVGSGSAAQFFSVLDVYVKCGASTDIVSSTFGVSAYVASTVMNQGVAFHQVSGSSWAPTTNDVSGVDSFVTAGLRTQSSANTVNLQGDTNFANYSTAGATTIASVAGSAGAGWYPGIGANTTTNPYARAGYYNAADNNAKATTTIAGNGIVAGGSLNNLWMVGRFVINATNELDTAVRTMTMQFAVAGKNNGVTTVTGATNAAYRYNQTLTFAVPAPGAAALLGLAGLVGRRRR